MAVDKIVETVLSLFILVVIGWTFFWAILPLGTLPALVFGIAMLVLIIALLKSFFR